MGHDLNGRKGILVGLDRCHIRGCQLAFAGEQVANALRPVSVQPFIGNVVGIVIVHDAIIGGDNEMLLRIVGLGQFIEGNEACPFILTSPSWGRKQRLSSGTNGNGTGHDIANIALFIAIDQVLRWHIPVAQGVAELFPVGGLVRSFARRR